MAALLAKALAIAVVIYAPCPAEPTAGGCSYRETNVVYVNPAYPQAMKQSRLHELGHIVDYTVLTDADRGTFEALMHMRRPWNDPPDSPHEQFAEAFRLCVRSTSWPRSRGGGYGYRPTVFQHRKICRWLADLAWSH